MAKFSQNTLNQVGGFDGQVLAQELVYNQKAFWNLTWANITSYTSGWQTGTTPINLTGATISAEIIRRSITNFRDSRTGLDFVITDYPLVSQINTITNTTTGTDILTCDDTSELFIGMPVQFRGTVFGGVDTTTRYFVLEVVSATQFKISATEFSTTPIALTTATGSMTATFSQHVYYTLQSGTLPQGVQVSDNGSIVGVPLAVASLQGVPIEVSQDVTSKFTIRAYTTNYVNGVYVLDAIRDRTFTLTIGPTCP